MKKRLVLSLLIFSHYAISANNWQPLLDNNLSNWDTYISFKHTEQYDGSAPKDNNGNLISPIGLNKGNDKLKVFSVIQENGQPVLKISGEYYGAVTSKQIFHNYHFKLKVRWGNKKWPPRLDKLMDSGILYHAIGEHGKEHFRSWMISQEFQIMHGHFGDYWNQVTTAIDIRAYQPEYIMNPVADEHQPFLKVGEGEDIKGFVLRKENHEYPIGQWNELELITFNGKSLHIVNGNVVMVLNNSRNVVNKKSTPLTSGKIQLQSEAAEVYYKDIAIKQLNRLPMQYADLFK